jgi:hypothetical protein
MAMKKTASANLTQALGATIIELTESGFTSQITVGGTATSGTIAFEYRNNGTWFTLTDKYGTALVIDMASNTRAYMAYGAFDAIRVTPTSIAGGYYVVEVISAEI